MAGRFLARTSVTPAVQSGQFRGSRRRSAAATSLPRINAYRVTTGSGFSLDDEEFRTGSNSTKERSLGSVGGRRVIFFPGVAMIFQRGTVVAFQKSFRYLPSDVMVISEHCAHILGALAIVVSLVIVWFYFYLRRVIARDEEALQKPRWR
jgi:hypothetical protein